MPPPHQAWCDCRPSKADPWRSLGRDPTTGTRQFSTTLLNTAICRVSCFQVCWNLALSSAQFYVKFVVMICTTALLIQTEETKETDSDVRWRPLGTPTAWWCRTWGRGRVTNFEWRRKIDMASVPRAKQWPPEWWKKVSDCFTTRWIKIMSFVQKPPQNGKKPGLYLFCS